jgi:hypothetical protein
MRCTGTVRLDAAFRAAHHGCCFGYIHILPVTHQESLALTRRQTLDFLLDDMHDLRAFDLVGAAFAISVPAWASNVSSRSLSSPSRSSRRFEKASPRCCAPSGGGTSRGWCSAGCAGTAAAVRRQACRRIFRQLDHGVLHDVQRGFVVAHGEHGLLEGASFHAGEKVGEFLSVAMQANTAVGRGGRAECAA